MLPCERGIFLHGLLHFHSLVLQKLHQTLNWQPSKQLKQLPPTTCATRLGCKQVLGLPRNQLGTYVIGSCWATKNCWFCTVMLPSSTPGSAKRLDASPLGCILPQSLYRPVGAGSLAAWVYHPLGTSNLLLAPLNGCCFTTSLVAPHFGFCWSPC